MAAPIEIPTPQILDESLRVSQITNEGYVSDANSELLREVLGKALLNEPVEAARLRAYSYLIESLRGVPVAGDWTVRSARVQSWAYHNIQRQLLEEGVFVLADVDSNRSFFNGTFLESFNALVTSNGTVVTMSIEQAGGGDLTMRFSDGRTVLDCTPAATITLTTGADNSPTGNFIYVLQSTKVLTKSTSDWPSAEHIKVGYFLVPSPGFVQAKGVYTNHNTNDHAQGTDGQGHLVHITERLRADHAIYRSGAVLTMTIGGGTTVDAAVSAGVVRQMHKHATPAWNTATGTAVLVINQNGAAYDDVTDLENLTNDANGVAVKKYFNWVIWGVANKGGEYAPLMLNLPTGSYNQQASAEADVSGYDVLTMPGAFDIDSATGFLIARVTMSKIGGTWAHVSTVDLRGSNPQSAVGGVGGVATEFADNAFKLFDESDNTKELVWQLSGISTGTTRTITAPDADLDLGEAITAASTFATNNRALRSDGTDRVAQSSSVEILDTGVMSIPGLGTGGYTDYDLRVGNVTTPNYGMIQIGNMAIGRTSYNVGAIDLDGAIIIRNIGGPATSEIELIMVESGGADCRFAIPKSGVGNATYNPRSMLIAGPAPADTDFVKVSFWQAAPYLIFDNLACDTAGSGADLGVQNNLEVEGNIYVDTILESTTDAGVIIETVLLKDGLVDGIDVAAHTHEGTAILSTGPVTDGFVLTADGAGAAVWEAVPGGGGETNTASNQGTDGVGVYDTKVGVDLQFRHVAPASSKVSVVLNSKDIDLDVVEANLSLANLGTRAITDLSDVAAKSGSGTTVIMQGSPTLTTPTIASFTNAAHDHLNAAGGTLITDASWSRQLTGNLDCQDNDVLGWQLISGIHETGACKLELHCYSATAAQTGRIITRRARGTEASKSVPNNGDSAGDWLCAAWDGDQWRFPGQMGFELTATPIDNSTPVKFFVELGATSRSEVFTIQEDGNVVFSTSGVYVAFADTDHFIHHAAGVGLETEVPTGELHRWTINDVQEMVLLADALNFGTSGSVNGRLEWPTASQLDIKGGNQVALSVKESGGAPLLSFFGATPIVKPTLTGSRGGNVALTNLLSHLASRGDIVNSTT